MRVTFLNLTDDNLVCSAHAKTANLKDLVLAPSLATTTDWPGTWRRKLVLRNQSSETSPGVESLKEWAAIPEGLSVRWSLSLGASWKKIKLPEDCPWHMYTYKVTRRHYNVMILTQRNLSSFLSEMPDRLPLSSLVLPGTHDTMALHGWPVSQCQSKSTPLEVQLQQGIRVLDVRLAIVDGRLIAYHGIYPQRVSFQQILDIVHKFLTAPPTSRETLVMSIKQEDFAKNSYLDFSKLVHDEIANGPGGRDMWFFDNKVPRLGEVRGKVVMFSRFGGNGEGWANGLEGLGIHPQRWPNSEKFGFTWDCKNTLVRTHDWYEIPSFTAIPEKVTLATSILLPAVNSPPVPTLSITFLSASSFPLALPPTIAQGFGWPDVGFGVEGVNSRVVKWLLDLLSGVKAATTAPEETVQKASSNEPRIRGWTLMDFYSDPEPALVPLLIECNFRGRVTGEEGW